MLRTANYPASLAGISSYARLICYVCNSLRMYCARCLEQKRGPTYEGTLAFAVQEKAHHGMSKP